MADADFTMGRGDAFRMTDQLTDADGNPLDTSGGVQVSLRYRIEDHTLAEVDATATVVDDNGNVEYHFAASETLSLPSDANSNLLANWIVTYPGGDQATVPSDRHLVIRVLGLP